MGTGARLSYGRWKYVNMRKFSERVEDRCDRVNTAESCGVACETCESAREANQKGQVHGEKRSVRKVVEEGPVRVEGGVGGGGRSRRDNHRVRFPMVVAAQRAFERQRQRPVGKKVKLSGSGVPVCSPEEAFEYRRRWLWPPVLPIPPVHKIVFTHS